MSQGFGWFQQLNFLINILKHLYETCCKHFPVDTTKKFHTISTRNLGIQGSSLMKYLTYVRNCCIAGDRGCRGGDRTGDIGCRVGDSGKSCILRC